MQSNETALNLVNEAFDNPENETEELLLHATRRLMDVYSYEAYQTYPRPSHPDVEKQRDVYFTMVSILISLRTTLENETRATEAFLDRYDSPEQVATADPSEIAEVIRVAGMPDRKAQSIIKATQYVIDELDNDWERFRDMDIDEAREELMKIPGVGQKSADCLLELGLDLPTIVIDVNMLRVVTRLFNLEGAEKPNLANREQLERAKKQIEDSLRKDGYLYQIVHTMLLLHGKNTCKSNPNCASCMLRDKCQYYRDSSDAPIQVPLFEN